MNILFYVLIGIVAGWLAGQIMKGSGFGLLGNLVVGVIGAVIGGVLLDLVGFTSSGLLGSLITAVIGAVVLLWVARMVRS
ncbi:MAG: GlsB/YeaQ/YmgE family stress response membrane protein [Chloroflexi bacterium]|nr:MAG: GlsB/YeaQ/YmgE family stress response membrane protein [Chloroflexota bacterium]MBL1194794.1 GlsB/YeaQ/YmgE family stress response membrane protein [Chloroflexota bacterium]NOH12086.1 GlsB/YeaQ/YmgE family stress response membrane protein [Chloroflexota bacterium]